MKNISLKQCPFCGAKEWEQDSDILYWYRLQHKRECFLISSSVGENKRTLISLADGCDDAERWNERVPVSFDFSE